MLFQSVYESLFTRLRFRCFVGEANGCLLNRFSLSSPTFSGVGVFSLFRFDISMTIATLGEEGPWPIPSLPSSSESEALLGKGFNERSINVASFPSFSLSLLFPLCFLFFFFSFSALSSLRNLRILFAIFLLAQRIVCNFLAFSFWGRHDCTNAVHQMWMIARCDRKRGPRTADAKINR